jgi:hypothetical protein
MWRITAKTMERAATPQIMRLKRIEVRISTKEEEEVLDKKRKADKEYRMVKHIRVNEMARRNLAHMHAKTDRKAVCTEPCWLTCNGRG